MLLNSFRTRLLLAIFGCAAVVIIAGGIFTYEMVERNLEHEFDHFLNDKLRFHRVSCMQHGNRLAEKLRPRRWATAPSS